DTEPAFRSGGQAHHRRAAIAARFSFRRHRSGCGHFRSDSRRWRYYGSEPSRNPYTRDPKATGISLRPDPIERPPPVRTGSDPPRRTSAPQRGARMSAIGFKGDGADEGAADIGPGRAADRAPLIAADVGGTHARVALVEPVAVPATVRLTE